MNSLVVRLLPYVLPPVLGAIIGYVTNYVAIRMLFRPLAEKRVFGIRIPFTPGIIPRQRYQLSQSIARMVSTKLLTEDAIRSKLAEPEFGENLKTSVSRFTGDFLDRLPGADGDSSASAEMSQLVTTVLEGFVGSSAFRSSASHIVAGAVDGALKLRVDQMAPQSETVRRMVGGALGAVSAGGAAETIRRAVLQWVQTHLARDTPLHEVLGPGTIARLADLLPRSYQPILDSLVQFLRQPETRKELALHGRELIKKILNRLSLFQRLVVSAAQYDRNLNENMPAIVSDVVDSLERAGRSPDTMTRIVAVFRSKLAEWGETGVATLGKSLSVDLAELADRAVTAGLELLGRQDVVDRASGSVIEFLERRSSDTMEELVTATLGADGNEVKERVLSLVDRWLERPDAAPKIAEYVSELISRNLAGTRTTSFRAILALSADQKDRIDTILAGKLREQLELRVPELVESLDVHGMVVQKIDALDVESVEQLLLMVIARHLKWINLFGALLGAIIGGTQVLVSQFT